jgi:parallel beta-helix repeat protein
MSAIRRLVLASLAGLALLPAAAAAAPRPAADPATRTLHRPTVITRPGLYTVGFEIAVGAGETAVRIVADDVTLDLGGRTLSGPGGPGSIGIEVDGARNVRIRNGALSGFGIGVLVEQAVNVVVAGLQITGTDAGGSPPDVEIGILLVDSRAVSLLDNQVSDTFLGIFVRGEQSGGNRITGNTLVGGAHGELAICYNPAPGQSVGGPDGDLVDGNLVSHFNRGIALSADSTANVVRNNTLVTFGDPIQEASPGANLIADNAVVALAP